MERLIQIIRFVLNFLMTKKQLILKYQKKVIFPYPLVIKKLEKMMILEYIFSGMDCRTNRLLNFQYTPLRRAWKSFKVTLILVHRKKLY